MRQLKLPLFVLIALLLVLIFIQEMWKNPADIETRVNRNLEALAQDQQADLALFTEQFTIYSNPFDINSDEAFKKRVYVNGDLVYWSDNGQVPDYQALNTGQDVFFYSSESNTFLVRKFSLGNGNAKVEIFSLLTLYANPKVRNQYLNEFFEQGVFEDYQIRLKKGDFTLQYESANIKMDVVSQSLYQLDEWILLCLLIISAYGVVSLLQWFGGRRDFGSWMMLIASLIVIRIGVLLVTKYVINVESFNPIYYISPFGGSLGDFLLNSICAFLAVQLLGLIQWKELEKVAPTALHLLLIFLLHLTCYVLFRACWNLLDNSLISLDITEELHFDQFRITAYAILLIWSAIFFRIFHFTVFWCQRTCRNRWEMLIVYAVVSLSSYLLYDSKIEQSLIFVSIGWWGVLLTRLRFNYQTFDYRAFLFVTIILALVCMVNSLAVYKHFEKDELISKRKFADQLLIKNDFLGEYYLNEKIEEIKQDTYIRTRISNPVLLKAKVKEKIVEEYLPSYFDKYQIQVRLFNAQGESLDEYSGSYDFLYRKYGLAEYSTNYDNIFFVEQADEIASRKYVVFTPIVSFDQTVGHLVLEMSLRKNIPRRVFPQLLVESKYYLGQEPGYDYAVFQEGKLLYKRGRFEFQHVLDYPDLQSENLFIEGLEKAKTHFLGVSANAGLIYVVASPEYKISRVLANFSFLFLVTLFGFSLFFVVARVFDRNIVLNLSTKIQLYLGLSFVLPMLVVSGALLNTLNSSYKDEIDKSFSKKAYSISFPITEAYERFRNHQINRDDLRSIIVNVANLIEADINLYNSQGKLEIASEQEIFKVGLLSEQIDPAPFNAIKYGNAEGQVRKQRVGELDFRVAYVGLMSGVGNHLIGVLSIPYFDSKNHLKRQQLEVFNSLLTISTLIFLVSLVAGNWVIERLVRPLRIITKRLQITDIKETNEPIGYHSGDEIGLLIQEYNSMITKLEESKAALAESQKESAWKEIARQVAHEIKNPLTPMRLKIQQMMRMKDADDKEYQSLNSLIGQIDALSSIADSFSAFAKMPAPKNQRFNFTELVCEVADVFDADHTMIMAQGFHQHVFVNADRKLFHGILNNIILNAIQAVEGAQPRIGIDLDIRPKKVVLSVKDNGKGILAPDREKVFRPYFSTKTTGSGIGLAVAKKGIENAGGNIWFESKEGAGTTFFISMPIVS